MGRTGTTECKRRRMRVPPHGTRAVFRVESAPMKNAHSVDTKSGTRDEIEGASKQLAGKVKEGLGKALGNPGLESRGDLEQIEGAVQKEIGALKRAIGK